MQNLPTSQHNRGLRTIGGYSLMRQFATSADAQAFAERLGEPKTKGEFFLAGFRENGEFAG